MPIAALCRHSTRQAAEIHAVRRRCQMRVSQFASLFVSFRCFWSKHSSFHWITCCAPTSMKLVDAAVGAGRVFWLGKRQVGDLQGERAERCSPGLTQATPRRRSSSRIPRDRALDPLESVGSLVGAATTHNVGVWSVWVWFPPSRVTPADLVRRSRGVEGEEHGDGEACRHESDHRSRFHRSCSSINT
jgi:hypothetical protein